MKGQAALEYLMTYGWVILVIVVVIGALYALGLTKPCKWVGTQVREFPDFSVETPKFTAAGSLAFDLSRIKPDTVNVTQIAAMQKGKPTSINTTTYALQMSSAVAPKRITLLNMSTAIAGDCYSIDVNITYRVAVAGGTETFMSSGKISGVVEA